MDIITHIPDLKAFRIEVSQKALSGAYGLYIDENGNVNYTVAKIPVHYSGNESICVVRLINQEEIDSFDSLSTCHKLGVVENYTAIFNVEENQATYERVRGDRKITITLESGDTFETELPYLIGGFQ